MIKMKIVLDEEKMLHEGYDIEHTWNLIDELFQRLELSKAEKGYYMGSNKSTDFAHFGLAGIKLGEQDWFLDNVIEWLWFNNDMSSNKNDFNIEDLLVEEGIYKIGFRC